MSAPTSPDSSEPSAAAEDAAVEPGRRKLVLATAVGACAIGLCIAAPAVRLVLAPLASGGGGKRWIRAVKLEQLRDGEPRRVAIVDDRRDAWTVERDVELGSVWLVRRGESVLALSAVCPHLGCSVNAVEGAGFTCPCHTSAFDPSGKRTGGPSPRDLDTLETKVEDGWVVVDFRRFRVGVEQKVEVA